MLSLDHVIENLGYDLAGGLQHIHHAVVEGQEKYPKDRVRPNDLIHLAQVAGLAAGYIHAYHDIRPLIVKPRLWKGSVPKDVHQKRILSQVTIGEACSYLQCNKTEQGHLIDAIGLALYAY